MTRNTLILIILFLFCSSAVWADSRSENYFASILRDGKKIGNIHYTITTNEEGELEELRTRVSLSVLGIKVYSFAQNLHERWTAGDLQTLEGTTDDDGTTYDVTLTRTATDYQGDANGTARTLPHDAFPRSPWHYQITEHSDLIDLKDLHLEKVEITKRPEQVTWNGQSVAAERFDFTGDWEATIWYDESKQFLKADFKQEGNKITVVMDP